MLCEACARGDHANCGMQSWCDCEDERDGDRESPPDADPYDPLEEFAEREMLGNEAMWLPRIGNR